MSRQLEISDKEIAEIIIGDVEIREKLGIQAGDRCSVRFDVSTTDGNRVRAVITVKDGN